MRSDRRSLSSPGWASATLLVAAGVLTLPSSAHAWCQMVSGSVRPTPAEPCVLAENHEGIHALSWRHRCTSISISHALPSGSLELDEVRGVFRDAIATWTNVECGGAPTGLSVELLEATNACTAASYDDHGDNVHAIVFVNEGWTTERMHDPRAYAVTYVWHDQSTGEILDADMEINEERVRFTICPESGCVDERVDLPNVVTHELGHYFGLAHSPDDPFATMYASASPEETSKRSLAADDIEGLCAIYPPGSLPERCDPAPRGGLDLSCSEGGCQCSAPGQRRGTSGWALGLLALALGLSSRGLRTRAARGRATPPPARSARARRA